ncbi:Imm49 family immunity protein [Streptomyces sp. NPDC090119]|uniref:Imm49 family immunity protein n=1 Tax=Streptomyces sp. NPDC090119 TaxID=3365951 RepID=UPI003811AF32
MRGHHRGGARGVQNRPAPLPGRRPGRGDGAGRRECERGTALFISGASTDGPVTLLAGNGDDLSELPATGPREYLHAVNWLTAYYLAVVCRDNERLAPLAITCMAHDAGMPVRVESEYLPKHLVYSRSSR